MTGANIGQWVPYVTTVLVTLIGALFAVPPLAKKNAQVALAEKYQNMGLNLTEKYVAEVARLEEKLHEKDARLNKLETRLEDLTRHNYLIERYNSILIDVINENGLAVPAVPTLNGREGT